MPDARPLATAFARRFGHREVTVVHLALALLEQSPNAWMTVLPGWTQRAELRDILEAELSGMPSVGLYRDREAAEPECLLLDLEVADVAPLIASRIEAARLDLGHLDDALARATALAFDSGHSAVRPEHVLRVLVDERWLGKALGADLDGIREALDERLAEYPTEKARSSIFPSAELNSLVKHATTYARTTRHALTSEIFVKYALGRYIESANLRAMFGVE